MSGFAPWPVAIRGTVLLAGVALLALPGAWHPVPFVITAVGVAAAVIIPGKYGASIATAGFVIAWVAAQGWAGTLPIGRTVAASAALYVLHVSTAFAGCVPLRARIDRAVVAGWVLRSALPVPVAAALVAVDEALPRQTGTPWVEFGGLVAMLLLGGAAVYAVRRRPAPLISMEGRARQK